MDLVKCRICGKEFKQIGTGHLMKHGLKANDYKAMFPDAEMTSPTIRKCLSEKAKLRPPQSEEKKKRISATMKKRYSELTNFPLKTQNQNQEGDKNNFFGKNHNENTKKTLSEKATKWLKEAYKNGDKISPFTYLGNGCQRSQFEIEVYRLLKPLGAISEYKVPFKKGAYKIDFAFIDKMIAIEIDSKLHDTSKIKKRDARKDLILKKNGWNVFRIKFDARQSPIDVALEIFNQVKGILS